MDTVNGELVVYCPRCGRGVCESRAASHPCKPTEWLYSKPACSICGGTAGSFYDGAHALCSARQKLGQATPSLGDVCSACHGAGRLPRSAACPVLNPSPAAIEAWAPTCSRCGGSGVEPGTSPDSRAPGVGPNLPPLTPA